MPLWLILVAALLASACTSEPRDEDRERTLGSRVDEAGRVVLTQSERDALGLETAVAVDGLLTTSTLRFGKVVARPQEDALVTAPLTGRLIAPTLSLGATVAQGDVLATLEPLVDTASRATLEAQRRELQGQVDGARAQVEAKRADLTRVATLVSSGLATQAERAQAEAALTSEQARLDSMRRAGDELAHMTGGRLDLRSPFPGVVATLTTEAGATIQQGTVIARILQTGPRWVDAAVPPADPPGSSYRVQGIDRTVPLELFTRGVVVQPDGTRRDRLAASPADSAQLLPGATVAVEVLDETRGVIVPETALVRRGRETLVFVAVDDGRYAPRAVQVTTRNDAEAVIASGVSAAERVVTRGASSLLGELGTDRGGGAGGEAQE